jgi:hypothetical protein
MLPLTAAVMDLYGRRIIGLGDARSFAYRERAAVGGIAD